MPEPILRLFGEVLLATSRQPAIPVLGAKALALLAFLSLERGPRRRSELTTLLWSEYPEERAMASLRQALTHVRAAVGEALRADRSTVELTGVTTDVTEFLRLASEDPSAAIEIDVPRFLGSLTLRNSPAFEDWADGKRRELLARYTRLLASCTRERMARREWREAIPIAERWSELEPLLDEPAAALMEAQYLAGERDAALTTHTRYVTRLAKTSSQSAGRSISDLAERIRREDDTITQARATEQAYDAGVGFTASLVGRSREWDELCGAWDHVAGGASGVVVIEGQPGAGKTRLAQEFLRWVTSRGGVVLRGRGYDARAGAPFGVIVEVLRSALGAPGVAGVDPEWLAEVARILPELRRQFAGLPEASARAGSGSGADSWRLFEAVAQVVAAIAEESPVAVFVDDLQWCDADSCGVLQSLVRRLADVPVLWCSSFSAGSVERDAPASRVNRALRATSGAYVVTLGPLGEEDVWRMIRELGRVEGPTAARRLAAWIHGVTAGNPFYVIELLKELFARGLLAVDPGSGGWMAQASALTDTRAGAFAPTLHETIAERIECLPDELRALLITIAVAGGRGTRTDVLSHTHGISRLRAAALGDALVERHLVVEDGGAYGCAHPVIAHVVLDGLGSARRAEVHRALAFALETLYGVDRNDSRVPAITRHAESAGERAMAYRYAVLAIGLSRARRIYDEALSWIGVAAASASTPDESAAVVALTTQLHQEAGWHEVPPIRARISLPIALMEAGDLDLPARA